MKRPTFKQTLIILVLLLGAFIAVAGASNNNAATGFESPGSKIKDFRETK